MEVIDNNSNENNISDATIVNELPDTEQQKIEAIDFKAFALQFLTQYSNIGQLTWTDPEPNNMDRKLEISIVRLLHTGEKQRIKITIENPDELKF